MTLSSPALEALRAQAGDRRVLLHVQFETTHQCNQQCRHCYLRDARADSSQELTLAEIERALDQLVDLQVLSLTLTGGEFFVRSDALDILRAAQHRGFAITLMTNGTCLNHEAVRQLAARPPLEVHIPLLGLEPVHDRLTRVRGSFCRAVRAMDRLREAGVRVRAKLILSHASAGDADALETAARAHADACTRSVDLLPGLGGEALPADLALDCDDVRNLCCFPREERPVQAAPSAPAGRPIADRPVCEAGRSLLAIGPTGKVYPCIAFRLSAGNLRETPLAELWAAPLLARIGRLTQADLAACADCAERAFCRYCPGRAWQTTGDWRRPGPDLCARARRFHQAVQPEAFA